MIERIREACQTHGAKPVSDAAYAAMQGHADALAAVGLADLPGIDTIGVLHQITAEAFELMTPAEKAAELSNATIAGGLLG